MFIASFIGTSRGLRFIVNALYMLDMSPIDASSMCPRISLLRISLLAARGVIYISGCSIFDVLDTTGSAYKILGWGIWCVGCAGFFCVWLDAN